MGESEQLALFDLPAPDRAAGDADEEMPQSMQALLDAGVPGGVVELLLERLGGCLVFVPKYPNEHHHLSKAVGLEAAQAIARATSNMLPVPICRKMKNRIRDAAILRDYDAGVQMTDIVRTYNLTERSIRGILGK